MSQATRVSWLFRVTEGQGRTIENAIEAALDGVPAPLTFELLGVIGAVTEDKQLVYAVRVKSRYACEPQFCANSGASLSEVGSLPEAS
jgi:hypothetical protein